MLRPVLAAGLAVAVLGLAGCTGPGSSSTSASPSAPPAPAPSASSSPSPSAGTLPADQCLTGTWSLVRFVGAGRGQTYGTGEGGDVTVRFSDRAYTLSGAGTKPITVTLAGNTADLRVDGRATGTYRLSGSTATFTQRSATGTGSVELGGRTQQLPMKQVTSVIGLQGDGKVACTDQAMTITLSTVRLELGRT